MRGYNILVGLLILLGTNCHRLVPLEPQNFAPQIPQNIFPANDTTDIKINITFIWSGGSADKNKKVSYDFYLKAGIPEPALVAANLIDTSFQYTSLNYNTRYYWKVVARNENGDSSCSPVWRFSTRYENSNPPNVPNSPIPENGMSSRSLDHFTLCWSGGDKDSFSIVTYDIYWGKAVDSLQLLSADQMDTFITINDLDFNTQYFWKIVAKDHYGLITAGPVWNFSTESAALIFEENFDAYPSNGYPETSIWTINKSDASLFITDSISWSNTGKSVCFIDSTESGTCFLATKLPARSMGILDLCWRASSNQDVIGLRLYSQQAQNERLGPQLSIRAGQLQYYDASYNWQTVCEIDSNTWYQIRLFYNCQQNFYKLFVNGELKIEKANWTGSVVPNLDLLYFITFDNRICQRAFLDEIKFFAGANRR